MGGRPRPIATEAYLRDMAYALDIGDQQVGLELAPGGGMGSHRTGRDGTGEGRIS